MCYGTKNHVIENNIIDNTSIIVKKLWIRFPREFHDYNFDEKFEEFYKTLGVNIPKYFKYKDDGIQYIFCIDKNLDINIICAKFGIKEFSSNKFITNKERFNFRYQIQPINDNRHYIFYLIT